MKKWLIGILLIPTSLYADTITTGSVGLIQPTRGSNSTRPWGDSLNSNFQVISNTFTDILNNISGLTQVWKDEGGSLGGNVKSVDCVGSGITCSQSVSSLTITVSGGGPGGGVSYTEWETAKSTTVNISDWQTDKSTGINKSDFNILNTTNSAVNDTQNSTITVLSQSTSSLKSSFYTYTSTADQRFNGVATSTNSLASFFSLALTTSVSQSDWNTAKSTTVSQSDWNVAKSTTVSHSDWNLAKSTTVNISDWQVAKSTTVSQSDWTLAKSTTINQSDWSTAKSTTVNQSDWNNAKSTTVSQAIWNVAKSSNDLDHESFKSWLSTNSNLNDVQNSTMMALRTSTSTLETLLSQRTLVFSDEGGAPGITVTRVDCTGTGVTCSQSGSTVTLNASGGAGGPITASDWNIHVTTSDSRFSNFTSTAQAVGISTQNIQSFFAGVESTNSARIDHIYTFTNSSFTAVNSATTTFKNTYNNFTSTVQTLTDQIASTVTAIRTSTDSFRTTYNTFTSTVQTLTDQIASTMSAIRTSTNAIETTLSLRTTVFKEEGASLTGGDVTTVNCTGAGITCSQSVSTVTINVPGGSSSGVPLPLPQGATNYLSVYDTMTITAAHTHITSQTFTQNIAVTSITFTNPNDGILRVQRNAGFELLGSTVIDNAISTMSVTFSSASMIYVVIYGSPTANPGGDMIVRFNGNGSPIYRVIRTTDSVNTNIALRGGVASSSNAAVGIPLFGVNPSTNSLRYAELKLFGNEAGQPKVGKFSGASISSETAAMFMTNGTFVWFGNEIVTKVECFMMRGSGTTQVPFALDSKWRVSSKMHVYGRND